MSNDENTSMMGLQCETKNGDNHYTASPSSPSRLTDFEIKECKKEPDSGWASDDLSEFGRSSINPQRTPNMPVPKIKNPIVLLERCDKIWETLKLIRVQCTSPTIEKKNEKEKKEKEVDQEVGLWNMTFKAQRRLIAERQRPFYFSVQKTRKLYPCVTCGKQYLEKRSLRKHALRIHGIIIPVRFRRKPRLSNMQNSNILLHEGNSNSDKVPVNKYGKTIIEKHEATKLPLVFTHSKKSQNVSDSNNDQSKNMDTKILIPPKPQYNKCMLCQQQVKSVKKHLTNYHKIGCSPNMLKQLETSLVIENKSSSSSSSSSSGSSKPTLKDILSGKPPEISINKSMQNKSYTASSENKTRETSQTTPQKRKYTLSYMSARKRFKLNNGHYVSVQNTSKIAQKGISVKNKCDICLGIYASANTLAKHRRIHISRGETKENFHKFVCKYFNSPLSKRYQQKMSSTQSADTDVEDGNSNLNGKSNQQSSNSPSQNQKTDRVANRAVAYDANTEDTTCLCGRSFRNHHILRAHKDNCKSCKQKNEVALQNARDEYSSDRDSGIGINITIKKRNNSYEIVGKDDEEDKQIDDAADDIPSSDKSHNVIKDVINEDVEQQQSSASNYSKNHSVLKLQDADEDLIIDIEEDAPSKPSIKTQSVVQRNQNNSRSSSRTQKDNDAVAGMKEDNTSENVRSLKHMCQEVLNKLALSHKSETKDAPTPTEKKKNVRPMNTSNRTTEKEHAKSEVSMVNFDLTTCAYCKKQFGTINLYNKHQCTVEEGRTFDEYSLNLLCFSCNVTLNSCNQFDQHMRTKHRYDRSYHCYLCPEKFWNKKARNKHTTTQHDTSCRFCHMDIPLWIINLHESYHLGFGYPCHKCKKAYSSKKNLAYHNTMIHKNGIDTMTFCNLCLQSVRLKNFQNHMHSHNGKKCHFCDKEFNDKTALEYHTLIYHGGAISKLKCNDCGMRYLTKKQLELHKNTAGCDRVKKIKESNML